MTSSRSSKRLTAVVVLQMGRRVDGLTVIFDMDGVSSKMLWRPGNSLTAPSHLEPSDCTL